MERAVRLAAFCCEAALDACASDWPSVTARLHVASFLPPRLCSIEFALKERQIPASITFEVLDKDKVSEDDPLGELTVPLGAPDVLSLGEAGNGAVSKPVREHALVKTTTGSLQFQVVVQEVDPSDESGALRIAAAERVGMISLKIKGEYAST